MPAARMAGHSDEKENLWNQFTSSDRPLSDQRERQVRLVREYIHVDLNSASLAARVSMSTVLDKEENSFAMCIHTEV